VTLRELRYGLFAGIGAAPQIGFASSGSGEHAGLALNFLRPRTFDPRSRIGFLTEKRGHTSRFVRVAL